ncbi:serine-rich adhesin for platelets-like [Anneissia japonica]|uniref:serine-rich adhesin for platelets-like n=1 Tax=Anneissia japonica TaxID=1529436 RepID=UPI001425AC28|nr:serine-rich adhesin for platelets-like [Anneissia japonica]
MGQGRVMAINLGDTVLSDQVYRSPVFPPPCSKVPKLPGRDPNVQERRDVLQDGVKLITDEDESKNDSNINEKRNENDNDSDSTEIDEDRNYMSDVIKDSDESPKRATFLLGHSQINNEDTDAKVLEIGITESCVPEMAATEAEEPEMVAPEAAVPEDVVQTDQQMSAVPEDVVQTDQQMSEATSKNNSWVDDEEQEALQDLERRLKKLRNGEPSIHCKLMSIKMQLRLLNESFKEQRTASLKKLAKLQRESSKNKQHEKLVNISSKQKVLLKLVKIYRNISNEYDIDINISNSSTPDGKKSGDGRQLSRHQSKAHQVESYEVGHSNQISATGQQKRSIQRLPRRDHQRRVAKDVDLNLVVEKLISAGLAMSTTATTSSTCSGDSVAPIGEMIQGISKIREHSLSDTVLGDNNITSKQVLPTSGSTASPCQEDANITVALTKEREDRTSTMKLVIQAGADVCSSVRNQVTNSTSAQSQKIISTNHPYQTTSQSTLCSSMLEKKKISVKNTNAPKVINILKPSKEVENNMYLSSSMIANNSRTVMTNQTLRNASLNYAMSKSKGRGVTIQYQASLHPSTSRSNIVTSPSSISTSSVSSSSATVKTSSLSPIITTTSTTTAAASQSSLNTANSLSSDASLAKQPADDQPLKDLLKNCRVSLIDDSELFPSRPYLPELFWTESFASIDLPSALINDIDNWTNAETNDNHQT